MYRILKSSTDVFGMANLNPQKSGLGSIIVWSDHGGVSRAVSHRNSPRAKLSTGNMNISISIEPEPRVLAVTNSVRSHLSEFQPGIDYVGRNYDIFLKHYLDTDFSFDDEDFFNALRERGEYK